MWQRWFDGTPDAQGSHTAIFDGLEQRLQWQEPWSKVLDKNNKIIEVRITGPIQWRVLGFYGDKRNEFVVVAVCNHKGKIYSPPDIKKTAVKRKKEIEKDPGKAPSCVRPR